MPPTAAAQERAMRFRGVFLQVTRGQLSWIQAADVRGVSARTMRRWRFRYQKWGVQGLHDHRRVTRAHNAVPEAEIKRWLTLYEQRYRGFNVRHFHALLRRRYGGCDWSYTVVRRALQGAGLVRPKRPRGRHFIRREPRPCFGEMLHIDGSRHRWLSLVPDTWQCLIAVVDDATQRLLYAQLVETESTHAILTALAAVIRVHGIPQSLYTDRAASGRANAPIATWIKSSGPLTTPSSHVHRSRPPAALRRSARSTSTPSYASKRKARCIATTRLRLRACLWGSRLLGRYSAQGKALSREPLTSAATPPSGARLD